MHEEAQQDGVTKPHAVILAITFAAVSYTPAHEKSAALLDVFVLRFQRLGGWAA